MGLTDPADDPCDGPGTCHGCQCWCNRCGDVANVCNTKPGERCDQHRCRSCGAMLTSEEKDYNNGTPAWCFSCHVSQAARYAMKRGENEVYAMDDEQRAIERWRSRQ